MFSNSILLSAHLAAVNGEISGEKPQKSQPEGNCTGPKSIINDINFAESTKKYIYTLLRTSMI